MDEHPSTVISGYSEEFVSAYIDACNPSKVLAYGIFVPDVPEIKRYLLELFREGHVWRYPHRLHCEHGRFPKWTYVYCLTCMGRGV